MNLETAKDYYIIGSREIIDANELMAKDSYGVADMITRKKINGYKSKLGNYYDWLREYDEAYSESLSINGTVNDLQMKQTKAAIAGQARSLFVASLRGYESEIRNVEASLNFRLTTSIAIIAIVTSVIGFV